MLNDGYVRVYVDLTGPGYAIKVWRRRFGIWGASIYICIGYFGTYGAGRRMGICLIEGSLESYRIG